MDNVSEKDLPLARMAGHDHEVTARVMRYAANARQSSHAHEYASISLVLKGEVAETLGRQTEYATPLSLVAKPSGIPHSDHYGPEGCLTLQIRFANQTLREREGRPVESLVWHHRGGPAVRSCMAFLRLLSNPVDFRVADPELAAYEILAALKDQPEPSCGVPNWLARVKQLLDDAAPSQSLRSLGEAAGVHPVYLTREFRRYFGCSIREYTKARRVRMAAALVGNSSLPLTDIAYQAGYADQPHLCRSFKDFAGLTPGDYRSIFPQLNSRLG